MINTAPQLNIKKLGISDHALKRARERLDYAGKSKEEILNLCKSILGSNLTKYIGISPCPDGSGESHMYTNNKNSYHISLDLVTIVTIINHESKYDNYRHYAGLESKI